MQTFLDFPPAKIHSPSAEYTIDSKALKNIKNKN